MHINENLDIEALRKTDHDQYRESLDQLTAQLSRLSDTHEYLDNLASFVVSKTDFRNSENIQSGRSFISSSYASSSFQQTGDLDQTNDGHENLDNQLGRSLTLCRNLIITLQELRAKRNEIKSYRRELNKLDERRQEYAGQIKVLELLLDGEQGSDFPEITINAAGDMANHVNEDSHIRTEFNIEYRNIHTLDQSSIYRHQRDNHSEELVDILVESLKINGWQNPVLLHDDNVIDGRARLLAAKKLGWTDIPVIDLSRQMFLRHYKIREIFRSVAELTGKQVEQYSRTTDYFEERSEHADTLEMIESYTGEQHSDSLRTIDGEVKSSRPDTQFDWALPYSPNNGQIDPRGVKAEISIVLDGKPVTLYYKSEILEMVRYRGQNSSDFSTNHPLSAIVLSVLTDEVSRTAKELAQDLYSRPKGFQWAEVVAQLRPRLTKILWRHYCSGDFKRINRGRYIKTDNLVEYANQIRDYSGDINLKDSKGKTPLFLAIEQNNSEAASIMLREGADVNIADKEGRTPLHRAAGYNSLEIAHLLINHGADIFAKDENGLTPKEWALREKSVEVSALLAEIN